MESCDLTGEGVVKPSGQLWIVSISLLQPGEAIKTPQLNQLREVCCIFWVTETGEFVHF